MKYNWSIIGHEAQLNRIEQDIESGNIAHAYLLVGPNSVGKHTVAKKMAGILQCDNDFCHECDVCVQVEKGSHVDTTEFRDDKESIKIDTIRSLIERVSMTRQGKYKIFLIQTIERMTTEAANSFLKVLEEPPPNTIFIMSSNNPRLILPTIISRVRTIKFSSVSDAYLVKKLREFYPDCDEETIRYASLFSLGKTGKALRLIERPDALAEYIEVYHGVQNFLNHRSLRDRFAYVEAIYNDKAKIDLFMTLLIHVLRSKILESSPKTDSYIKTLLKIEEAGILLGKNVNSRLVLENLMLTL